MFETQTLRTCAWCRQTVSDETAAACPSCRMHYHPACWEQHAGCATAGCRHAAGSRTPRVPVPVVSTTSPETQHARKRRASRTLLVTGVIALVGLGLFGLLAYALLHAVIQRQTAIAHEATLKDNLRQLRNAVEQFQADTGYYPMVLTDLTVPTGSALTGSYGPGGTETAMVKSAYHGPYLTPTGGIGNSGIPANPYASPKDTVMAHHWLFDPSTGMVKSAVNGLTGDGERYSEL